MITERDITLRVTAKRRDPETTTAEDIISNNILTEMPQMEVYEAADLMAQHQVRHLPIAESDEIIGIITLGDLAAKNIYQDDAMIY